MYDFVAGRGRPRVLIGIDRAVALDEHEAQGDRSDEGVRVSGIQAPVGRGPREAVIPVHALRAEVGDDRGRIDDRVGEGVVDERVTRGPGLGPGG